MILVANLLIDTYHTFRSLSLIALLAPSPSEDPPPAHNSLETRVLATIK
jgi:hypothetical protein